MTEHPEGFDLVVVGGGPGGHAAAIQATKLGARVAVVERAAELGGRSVRLGSLPSKTFRETIVALDAYRIRSERDVEPLLETRMDGLMRRFEQVSADHHRVVAEQLARNGVTVVSGRARFEDLHLVSVEAVTGERRWLEAPYVVVATGCRPRHLPALPVDHEHVLDSDSVFSQVRLPRSLAVVGAGALGCEFVSVFAALGVEVTLVDGRERPLEFMDPDLTDHFEAVLRRRGGRYLPRTRVVGCERGPDGVTLRLDGAERSVTVQRVVSAVGRVGCLGELGVDRIGLEPSPGDFLEVDEALRTEVPHVYAVGDIAGPPFTATWAAEQGRRAARHALARESVSGRGLVPRGVYTIPEMASVGLSEAQAVALGGAVVGVAAFEELARGHISGVAEGMLKLVASVAERRVLGVHIMGEGAIELIHVGQMALASGASLDALVENAVVFPSFAEAYRVAALDALSQIAHPPPGPRRVT